MQVKLIQGDAARLPLADNSVDLVLGSPPYVDARKYLESGKDIGISRKADAWVEWMLQVTAEAVRVSRGLVVWVATGVTRDKCYQPACEGLMWEWYKRGGILWRPAFWHRNGIPGSGGKQWFRADVEYCMAFKGESDNGDLPWSDNTACGHKPRWGIGGEMSNRLSNGDRVNQRGRVGGAKGGGARRANGEFKKAYRPSHQNRPHGEMRADGSGEQQECRPPAIANPGTMPTFAYLLHTNTGGGHLGHPLAHENEAPYPQELCEFFIKSFCPPGGTVLDPFNGSGTTVCTAQHLDRSGIGIDLRASQLGVTRRRLADPYMKKVRPAKPETTQSLFAIPEAA